MTTITVTVPADLLGPLRHAVTTADMTLTAIPGTEPHYVLAVVEHRTPGVDLTHTESRVLFALAQGGTNAAIGRALGLGENAVKDHLKHLSAKLGARDRTHAVHIAHQRGLLGGGS